MFWRYRRRAVRRAHLHETNLHPTGAHVACHTVRDGIHGYFYESVYGVRVVGPPSVSASVFLTPNFSMTIRRERPHRNKLREFRGYELKWDDNPPFSFPSPHVQSPQKAVGVRAFVRCHALTQHPVSPLRFYIPYVSVRSLAPRSTNRRVLFAFSFSFSLGMS